MGALASADIACCSGVQYCVESVSILQEAGQESVAMSGGFKNAWDLSFD